MNAAPRKFALLAYGFRPFFLASFFYAFVSVAAWIYIRDSGLMPLRSLPPQLWHAHEMLFGFMGAAIAGFLLTAVPSWTGSRGFAGWPLALLISLWALGRVAFAAAAVIPIGVLTFLELSFLPLLAAMIAPPIWRSKNRNLPILLLLLVFWFIDATFVCAMARGEYTLASSTVRAGLDVVLLLVTIIGGRIVPAFTANAFRRVGITAAIRTKQWIEVAVVTSMVAVLAIDIGAPGGKLAAAAAAIAAVAHGIRLSGWQSARTFKEPIVWILHVAYAWLPIGLVLKAVFLSTAAPWAADWLHALTVGAAATMIVAVITRASLGHTGRTLIVSKAVALAYTALSAGALLRAFATAFAAEREWLIRASALLWLASFAALFLIYFPVLTQPRVDGREG